MLSPCILISGFACCPPIHTQLRFTPWVGCFSQLPSGPKSQSPLTPTGISSRGSVSFHQPLCPQQAHPWSFPPRRQSYLHSQTFRTHWCGSFRGHLRSLCSGVSETLAANVGCDSNCCLIKWEISHGGVCHCHTKGEERIEWSNLSAATQTLTPHQHSPGCQPQLYITDSPL